MMDNNGIQFNQQSPAFNAFGGFQNFQQQFNGFMGNMSQMMNPNSMAAYCEQQMRSALASGKISQEQFNSMAQTVNQMMGR